jgi:hypothetical protein
MNNENLSFLLDSLKFLGFGERPALNEQLEDCITQEIPEFKLYTESFYDEDYRLETLLHFRKAEKYDMYFFNKYEALLRRGDDPETDRTQTFYINKGTGITLKEAFNLLQGRAVNKDLTNAEGEKYNAWLQLNFEELDLNHNHKMRQFGKHYGYDLEKVLEKYPIRELQLEESKVLLLKGLRRGNLQPVHLLKPNNKVEKMFIEASPQFKTINIYTSVAKAMQKLVKRPAPDIKMEVHENPGGPESEERKEEESVASEESAEEGIEMTGNKSAAKKGGRR